MVMLIILSLLTYLAAFGVALYLMRFVFRKEDTAIFSGIAIVSAIMFILHFSFFEYARNDPIQIAIAGAFLLVGLNYLNLLLAMNKHRKRRQTNPY